MSIPNKRPLGRGLSSLIPQSTQHIEAQNEKQNEQVKESMSQIGDLLYVDIMQIIPNPYQPRTEFDEEEIGQLSASIKEQGLLQPLVVTKLSSGQYELIAGERRLRASKKAGLTQIPVVLRSDLTAQDKAELALIENIQRQDLNPLERAQGFADLQAKFQLTQEQISQKMHLSRSYIANSLRLLSLSVPVQQALRENVITEGHAKVLAGISDQQKQVLLLKKIVDLSLNVRKTEKIAKKSPKELEELSEDISEIAQKISEVLHSKVEIRKRGKRYIITLNMFSEREIKALLDRLVQ